MNSNAMKYNGQTGSIEHDLEQGVLYRCALPGFSRVDSKDESIKREHNGRLKHVEGAA